MKFKEIDIGLVGDFSVPSRRSDDRGSGGGNDSVRVFFGGLKGNFENIRSHFTDIHWSRIRQTHSDLVLEAESEKIEDLPEADAQISQKADLGLLISTADCVPVFFFDPYSKWIGGIHAGWRGVASRIIPKAIDRAFPTASRGAARLQVFIGPHIQFDSFEIREDVRDELLASVQNAPADLVRKAEGPACPTGAKFFLDLNRLVLLQLQEKGVKPENIVNLRIDTKTDPRFHSHRRDQAQAGRQLSFICRKME